MLRISLAVCVALLGVQTMRAQHAFEYAARIGANALLYDSDYGKPMPNYNVGMDFSWKYRSPYYIGVRVGLGIDVAASTFVAGGNNEQVIGLHPGNDDVLADFNPYTHFPITRGGAYADYYVADDHENPVNIGYSIDRFTETQQLVIASVPVQLGIFVGDFSMFLGARAGIPVHGCYWQRIRNANMHIYYPMTDVTFPTDGPDNANDMLKAGLVERQVNGITPMSKDVFPLYSYHITAMVDVNYSFRVGDNTDFAIGAYLEYDPLGYSLKTTNNTSLMEWGYVGDDEHTGDPMFRRAYSSVLEANRAEGITMGESTGTQLVRKYNRASVGLRVSVSLWNVPLEFGKNYRKQQLYKVCMCDFF